MRLAELGAIAIFGNAVAVVAAALLPAAMLGLPVLSAMLLPFGLLGRTLLRLRLLLAAIGRLWRLRRGLRGPGMFIRLRWISARLGRARLFLLPRAFLALRGRRMRCLRTASGMRWFGLLRRPGGVLMLGRSRLFMGRRTRWLFLLRAGCRRSSPGRLVGGGALFLFVRLLRTGKRSDSNHKTKDGCADDGEQSHGEFPHWYRRRRVQRRSEGPVLLHG
jgi:hypothetical protein